MDLYFRDNMHRKYFQDILKVFDMAQTDKELYSTIYLISGSIEFDILGRYIDAGRKIIHLESFIDSEDFFSMQSLDQEMARLAAAIYQGSQCDVVDCFKQLNGPDLKIALNALELRFSDEELISD